ncbi:MAG TPA: hypothetical protein VFX92_06330 [Candidatus Krumholzibacteria bacterium]|nr:hypothetical protein [Candidatus Krumholzibacteria bacterium]
MAAKEMVAINPMTAWGIRMPDEPILLVLGAGASVPFGFPTGRDLCDSIIDGLADDSSPIRRTLGELGYGDEDIGDFRDRLTRSVAGTIDQFLEHNWRYSDMGRAIMAHELARREDEARLFDRKNGNWYALLARHFFPGPSDLDNRRIGFVTFNYDRSLEHFLFTWIVNRLNRTEADAARFVNSLTIDHMYGKLGHLPWEQPNAQDTASSYSRPYGMEVACDAIAGCAECLRIPYDPGITREPFRHVSLHLGSYRAIHFLGFGYDDLNLRRLGVTEDHGLTTLHGSAYKVGQRVKERIESGYRIQLDREGRPALEYLQEVLGWE